MVTEQENHGNVVHIAVEEVDANPYQPRTVFNEVALQELAASILTYGVLQPLLVRRIGARYQLVSGERRFQASKRAGLATVPAILQNYDDLQMLEVALVENVQREDISPLEAAEAYKRLRDEFSLSQEQIALRVGKSRPAVSNTLRLLNLPAGIQDSLRRGDISEGHARSLLAIPDPEWQNRVWQRIVEDSLSVRDVEGLTAGAGETREEDAARDADVSRETPKKRRRPRLAADLRSFEGKLRQKLGTKVQIKGTADHGRITLEYYGAADLSRLAEILGLE